MKKTYAFLLLIFSINYLNAQDIRYLGIEQGLSNNSVRCIFQDSKGFIWLGTYDGLNRYDGYDFTVFRNKIDDSLSLTNNIISTINEDNANRIWIGTRNGGNLYDPATNKFLPFRLKNIHENSTKLLDVIKDIKFDNDNNVFVASETKGLLFAKKDSIEFSRIPIMDENGQLLYNYGVQTLLIDKLRTWVFVQGKGFYGYNKNLNCLISINNTIPRASCFVMTASNIWFAYEKNIYNLNKQSNKISIQYSIDTTQFVLNSVLALSFSNDGKLWVGTNATGITILDTATHRSSHLKYGENRKSLTSNYIYSIFLDNKGRHWIGTFRGGLNLIDPLKQRFQTVIHEPGNQNSLPANSISSILQVSDNIFWVGTEGNGVNIYDKVSDAFKSNANLSVSQNFKSAIVTFLLKDYTGHIWISTLTDGIYGCDKNGNNLMNFELYNKNPGKLTKVVSVLCEDKNKTLWAGSLRQGDIKGAFYRFDRLSKRFEMFDDKLSDIFCLHEDASQNLWAGDLTQLIWIDKVNKKHTFYNLGASIRSIHDASDTSLLWLGTEGGGLILFNKRNGHIMERYSTENGLANNTVSAILSDTNNNLWISTYSGISCLNPVTKKIVNFYQSDGLQSNQFHMNAACNVNTGELIFGGIKGFSIFYPGILKSFIPPPPLYLSGISINGKKITVESNFVDAVSAKNISSVKIPYDEAILDFHFTTPEFSYPEKIRYSYYLEGWDKGWSQNTTDRKVSYRQLREGDYTFRVRCQGENGAWSNEVFVNVRVMPPWFRSWWAYTVYILTVSLLIYLYFHYKAQKTRLSYNVKIARLEAENKKIALGKKEAEYQMIKSDHEKEKIERENERILSEQEKKVHEKMLSFFTNVTHEFRSPLTLIINPVKDLMAREEFSHEKSLSIIQNNAKRLLSLIDQLLLFRKADSGLDTLIVSKFNLSDLVEEVYGYFLQQAIQKKTVYKLVAAQSRIMIYGDKEKIEIIVYNLVSNAIKYVPEGGSVVLSVEEKINYVSIKVQNTGQGIPNSVIDRVFEKFYRAENNGTASGFGIGLYLVKEFVLAHTGNISVKNLPEGGVCFEVELLKGKNRFSKTQINDLKVSGTLTREIAEGEQISSLKVPEGMEVNIKTPQILESLTVDKKTIFIVDDDAQMREYIKDIFADEFIVQESDNADTALKMSEINLPEVIISDISMKGMDGIEFCGAIKSNPLTSHIPFILVTGKTSDAQKLSGIEKGADDYIIKPFDKQILLARVNSLLKKQTDLQKYFFNEITLNKSNMRVSEEYKIFLETCIKLVEKHLEDEDFGVKKFTEEIGMSHTNLFQKVKSVSGLSINVFIRFIRLRKAAELFINTDLNVNQTAYQVGMNDVRYFREQFFKVFGINPSEYIKKYRKTLGKTFRIDKENFSKGG